MKTIRTMAMGTLPVLLAALLMGALVSTANACETTCLDPEDVDAGPSLGDGGGDAAQPDEGTGFLGGATGDPETGATTVTYSDGRVVHTDPATGTRVETNATTGVKVTTRADGTVEVDFTEASAARRTGSVWMDVWPGGSVTEAKGVSAIWVIHDGGFLSYTTGAPEWVNAKFLEVFPDGQLPADTAVLTVV